MADPSGALWLQSLPKAKLVWGDHLSSYGMSRKVGLSFDDAVSRVTELLKGKGFGVLTRIDIQATMKEKLGVDGEPYVILGACNPNLAHQALGLEHDIGLLLPCNVIVYKKGDRTTVAALDPEAALGVAGNQDLLPVASEARERLKSVIESM